MSKSTLPWPRLSETLPHQRHPWCCQCCGINLLYMPNPPHELHRECDDHDQPTRRVIALCKRCADRLIEPHPRLYQRVPENKPAPGAMPHLCVGCRWRVELDCTHPALKANGGPGLNITVAEPALGFWDGRGKDGRRTGGIYERWPAPASACAGAEPLPE